MPLRTSDAVGEHVPTRMTAASVSSPIIMRVELCYFTLYWFIRRKTKDMYRVFLLAMVINRLFPNADNIEL